MRNILFGDTETTGIPDWQVPSNRKHQPHMVQLAAVVANDQTQDVIQSMDVIIRPDGWIIPEESSDVHGITHELAMDVGISEKAALEMFLELWQTCALRVFHNTTFDNRILRIAMMRYMPDRVPDEVWKDRSLYYCTFLKARKIMGGKSGHTLEDVYLHFTGKTLENAHSAMPDTLACKEIFFAIQEREA